MSDFKLHHYTSINKGALLDSNILSAFLVGALGEGEVEKFKRTRHFITEDVIGMDKLFREFGWSCTTPHVLTEVSNLLDWMENSKKQKVKQLLASFVTSSREFQVLSSELVVTPVFFELGITDAALHYIANKRRLVLITTDLPLYQYTSGLGVEVINFNHIRQRWL